MGKELFHTQRLKAIVSGEYLPPPVVEIDPSNACNQECVWCISKEYRDGSKKEIIKKDALFALLRELQSWQVKYNDVAYTENSDNLENEIIVKVDAISWIGGGEPLVSKNVAEAITLSNELGFQNAVVTNGVFLDRIGSLANIISWVGVDVDAGNAETYHKVHGTKDSNEFNVVLKNMRDFVQKGGTVDFKFLIDRENVNEIGEAVKLAKDIGCRMFFARPAWYKDKNRQVDITDLAVLSGRFQELSEKYDLPVNYQFVKAQAEVAGRQYSKCRATPLVPVFGADGNIHICCDRREDKSLVLCSWMHDDWRSIWSSQKHRKIIDEINLEECPRCRYDVYNTTLAIMANTNVNEINFL